MGIAVVTGTSTGLGLSTAITLGRGGHTVFAPHDAGERWPLEKQYERSSYLGLSCHDSAGRVIGHIACADDKAMREELPHQAILKIFAMRAAMELERVALDRMRPPSGLPLITVSGAAPTDRTST